MKLKKLHIQNYKSLVDLEIIEPNPFTVFAGPNGSGKSNIFEALEFAAYNTKVAAYALESIFGGREAIVNFNSITNRYSIALEFDGLKSSIIIKHTEGSKLGGAIKSYIDDWQDVLDENPSLKNSDEFMRQKSILDFFFVKHLRLFIKNSLLNRINFTANERLLPDASNLESILKQILSTKGNEEFTDWLDLFIPGFEKIEIHSDNISGKDSLLIYEKGTKKPFTKNLISDGTYNILCLLAAVYQAKEPQFLCIEEPENGLNPYVVESLASFFRQQCEEKGHYIWLNTHSQTLVKELQPHELILVDKVNGATKVKQFSKDHKLYGLEMDKAWLSNALGGGVPW